MKVENRTFIVSGGSSGLGLATVQDLIKSKAYVSILDLAPPPSVFENGEEKFLQFIKTDITVEAQLQSAINRIVEWTKETGAALGGVLSCAGVIGRTPIVNEEGKSEGLKTWDFVLGVNLTGTYNLIRLSLEHLVKVKPEDTEDEERGVIILTGSEASIDGQAGQAAYAASKSALSAMTLPLARDLAKHHVRVVNISPAPFLTPMLGNQPEPVIRTLKEKVFLYPNRFGRPEEFAKTVRWILDCAYVNGETIRLTGGGRVPGFLG